MAPAQFVKYVAADNTIDNTLTYEKEARANHNSKEIQVSDKKKLG